MCSGRTVIKNLICLFLFVSCFAGLLLLSFTIENASKGKKREVPVLIINLDGVTLEEINSGDKTVSYKISSAELISNGTKRHFNDLEIRGRGNASWGMDKRSYRIKIPGGADILGLGKQNKLGLISNNIDNSLMRNDLGQHIAGLLYEDYPIKGEFIDVQIDDQHLGLYYMVILIDVDKHSLKLKDDMGVVVEIDNAYCVDASVYDKTNELGDCIVFDNAVEGGNELAFSNFVNDYDRFEKALKKKDYETVSKIIDVESWAKYFILSEFTSNPDAYVTSWYLYRDGEKDKIKANVGWDFDAAFGNRNWGYWDEEFYSPYEEFSRMEYSIKGWRETHPMEKKCSLIETDEESLISPSMCYLIAMPEFQKVVSQIYRGTLMSRRVEINEYIKRTSAYIRDDAIADNEMWSKGNFDDEIEYLLWWVKSRFNYFDEKYGSVGD